MVLSTCENTPLDSSKYLEILNKARILTDSFLAFKGPEISFACALLTNGHLTGRALESNTGIYRYAVVSGITPKGQLYLERLENAPVRTRLTNFVVGGFQRVKTAFFK